MADGGAALPAMLVFAVIGYYLARHPSAADALGPVLAVIFATVLVGCLWLALRPPRVLTTSRAAGWIGAGAAVALTVGLVVVAHLPVRVGIQAAVWTAVLGTALILVEALRWNTIDAGLLPPTPCPGRCRSSWSGACPSG